MLLSQPGLEQDKHMAKDSGTTAEEGEGWVLASCKRETLCGTVQGLVPPLLPLTGPSRGARSLPQALAEG